MSNIDRCHLAEYHVHAEFGGGKGGIVLSLFAAVAEASGNLAKGNFPSAVITRSPTTHVPAAMIILSILITALIIPIIR